MVRKIYMIDPQTHVATGDVNGDGRLDAAFGGAVPPERVSRADLRNFPEHRRRYRFVQLRAR
jgi:hypothetical protein